MSKEIIKVQEIFCSMIITFFRVRSGQSPPYTSNNLNQINIFELSVSLVTQQKISCWAFLLCFDGTNSDYVTFFC